MTRRMGLPQYNCLLLGDVHQVKWSESPLSRVWLFATPRTVARQAPQSMGILQARVLEGVAIPFSRGSGDYWIKSWMDIFLSYYHKFSSFNSTTLLPQSLWVRGLGLAESFAQGLIGGSLGVGWGWSLTWGSMGKETVPELVWLWARFSSWWDARLNASVFS